jgi:hypothetical protein
MPACEQCWSDAWLISHYGPESHVEAYQRLLTEREGHQAIVTITNESQSEHFIAALEAMQEAEIIKVHGRLWRLFHSGILPFTVIHPEHPDYPRD